MAQEITDNNFEEIVLKSDKPVLVDFWAAWCGPCRMVGPIIDEISTEYEGKAIVGNVVLTNSGSTITLSTCFELNDAGTGCSSDGTLTNTVEIEG